MVESNGQNIDIKDSGESQTRKNTIWIHVLKTEFKNLKNQQRIGIGITTLNFIVLLIMVLQLSSKIFS